MATFNIDFASGVLTVSFGTPAHNDQIVKDARARLDELVAAGTLSGGGLLKVTGPMSMPVAFVLCHGLAHLFSAIAIFDPKLNKYVIAVTHDPAYAVGDLTGELLPPTN